MNKFGRFLVFLFNVFYPYKRYGKENIPEGGAILICNHLRATDPAFIADFSYKNTYFLAKKQLFKNKLFGGIIKGLGAIPIDREKPDLTSLKKSLEVIKNGGKLVIFPEGTRNKTKTTQIQQIKGGTAFLAVKAKCPICPMIIYNRSKIFRKTHVIAGKPFDFSEYYDKKVSAKELERMDEIIKEKMIELQKEISALREKKK